MVSLLLMLAAPGVRAQGSPPPESDAYGCKPEDAVRHTITSPANGVTVGRTFALAGTIKPTRGYQQYISVQIDGEYYVDPKNRNFDPNNTTQEYFTALTDLQGNFNYTIDLSGEHVTEQYVYNMANNGSTSTRIRHGVTAGAHKITVGYYGPCSDAGELALTVKEDAPKAAAPVVQYTEAPKPTPTPSASPSITPTPEAVADSTGKKIPPAWWVVFGVLGGVASLLLGQQGWKWYRHRKSGTTIAKSK